MLVSLPSLNARLSKSAFALLTAGPRQGTLVARPPTQGAAAATVIEGTAEPVALPAPEAQSHEATPEPTQKHKSNRLMREADTAVGPRERVPGKVRPPPGE